MKVYFVSSDSCINEDRDHYNCGQGYKDKADAVAEAKAQWESWCVPFNNFKGWHTEVNEEDGVFEAYGNKGWSGSYVSILVETLILKEE